MPQNISILDTTLRDGEQSEGISFTVQDKVLISQCLDNLGIHYIEGGWPSANPKALAYFKAMEKISLSHSKLVAFGSTRRAHLKAEEDPSLICLKNLKKTSKVIFGKTWGFHVEKALNISLKENLALITDSIRYLKEDGSEVIFDAEHFFDGYKQNPSYALDCLHAAIEAGTDIVCLCDTNGGILPSEAHTIISTLGQTITTPLGIHAHNDCGMGVAVSIAAVEAGVSHVQGTLNGYGERCGNATLSSIIPTLWFKKKIESIPTKYIEKLTAACHAIDEIANINPSNNTPFVGKSAFTHKGGIHVSAILKHSETYEHIHPEWVGNTQRIVVSDVSGLSNLRYKAKQFGIDLQAHPKQTPQLLETIKNLEHAGYQFEGADASLHLFFKKTLRLWKSPFQLERFRAINEGLGTQKPVIEAVLKASVNQKGTHKAADGNGPVSALDNALRMTLAAEFPGTKMIKLIDYKVRVLDSHESTHAKVRVLISSTDGKITWHTVGVSENIIEASWQALLDSFEFYIMEYLDDNKTC